MHEGAAHKMAAAAAGQTVASARLRTSSRQTGHRTRQAHDGQRAGTRVPALLLDRRRRSVRPGRMGARAMRSSAVRKGSIVFEQRQVEMPKPVVAAGDQHRRLEVLPRPCRLARTRTLGQAAHRPRRRHHHRVGAQTEVFRLGRRAGGLQRRFEASAGRAEGRLQQPGLVQLRLREGAAVLGVLHQLGRRHDGVDPRRWPRPRACSSSTARAPAATCRRFARRRNCSPAAAPPRARCRS